MRKNTKLKQSKVSKHNYNVIKYYEVSKDKGSVACGYSSPVGTH